MEQTCCMMIFIELRYCLLQDIVLVFCPMPWLVQECPIIIYKYLAYFTVIDKYQFRTFQWIQMHESSEWKANFCLEVGPVARMSSFHSSALWFGSWHCSQFWTHPELYPGQHRVAAQGVCAQLQMGVPSSQLRPDSAWAADDIGEQTSE